MSHFCISFPFQSMIFDLPGIKLRWTIKDDSRYFAERIKWPINSEVLSHPIRINTPGRLKWTERGPALGRSLSPIADTLKGLIRRCNVSMSLLIWTLRCKGIQTSSITTEFPRITYIRINLSFHNDPHVRFGQCFLTTMPSGTFSPPFFSSTASSRTIFMKTYPGISYIFHLRLGMGYSGRRTS